ncbi:MAG: GAF domain-containing protein, partial [Candidatus Binatia bacterium]
YAASTRLQETLRRQDVLAAIREIAVNLIGIQDMAVFAVDAQTSTLLQLDGFDSEQAANYHDIPMGIGPIGQAALTGNSYFDVVNDARRDNDANTPMACIPLPVDGRVWGVIVVFRLLPQKNRLVPLDYQLFELLSAQAAMALHRAELTGERGAATKIM